MADRQGSPRPVVEGVEAFLAGGGDWVWLRDKDLSATARRRLGEALAERVWAEGGTLVVGGDIALAADLGADGVHLGGGQAALIAEARARLGARALVGVSAHSVAEVEAVARRGADYATLSPIFPTASKPGYGPALGTEAIAAAAATGLPVVALGGVTAETLGPCRAAGAAAVAVMGGLMQVTDPAAETRRLLRAWRDAG